MGDDNFFQAIQNYLNDPNLANGYAKTPDLQYHLEQVSGLSFDEFFNDWLYGEGFPIYSIYIVH
jgi:aminopeptidase N